MSGTGEREVFTQQEIDELQALDPNEGGIYSIDSDNAVDPASIAPSSKPFLTRTLKRGGNYTSHAHVNIGLFEIPGGIAIRGTLHTYRKAIGGCTTAAYRVALVRRSDHKILMSCSGKDKAWGPMNGEDHQRYKINENGLGINKIQVLDKFGLLMGLRIEGKDAGQVIGGQLSSFISKNLKWAYDNPDKLKELGEDACLIWYIIA